MRRTIEIGDSKSTEAVKALRSRTDFKSVRIAKLLDLPDLSRKDNSPVKYIAEAVVNLPRFKDFDIVTVPKIVTAKDNFDTLNTPADHPSRRESDTYYVDKDLILRTQMTVVWPYYYNNPATREKLERDGEAGCLSHGIVFRKDEIDRSHFPAFHQVDGVYIVKKSQKTLVQQDLKDVLVDVAKSIYGQDVEYDFRDDTFPFTRESLEMNVKLNGAWLEVLGSGIVHDNVLRNLNLDPAVYNGWAFGFGIDRLAMAKMGIGDIRVLWSDDPRITKQFTSINSTFKEVSKYPPVVRDISFVVDKSLSLNNYYEIARDCAGNLIEEIALSDKYENAEKFGANKVSYTFRITYRSPERTLTNQEVNDIHDKIRAKTESELKAVVR